MVKEKFSMFDRIVSDIRTVQVQGAENVARAGIRAYALRSDKDSLKKILLA